MGIKGSSRDSSLGLIPVEAMSGIIYTQIQFSFNVHSMISILLQKWQHYAK